MYRAHATCVPTHAHDGAARVFFHGHGHDIDHSEQRTPWACVTVGVHDGLLKVWEPVKDPADPSFQAQPLRLRQLHTRFGHLQVRTECRTNVKDAHAFVRLSAGGKFVFSASPTGVVLVRRIADGAQVARRRLLTTEHGATRTGLVTGIAVSNDDAFLFVAVGPSIHVLRFDEEALTLTVTDHVFNCAHGADEADAARVTALDASPCKSNYIITATYTDGSVRSWDATPTVLEASATTTASMPQTFAQYATDASPSLPAQTSPRLPHDYRCAQQSPDASLVACGTAEGGIVLFDCVARTTFWTLHLAAHMTGGTADDTPPAPEVVPDRKSVV